MVKATRFYFQVSMDIAEKYSAQAHNKAPAKQIQADEKCTLFRITSKIAVAATVSWDRKLHIYCETLSGAVSKEIHKTFSQRKKLFLTTYLTNQIILIKFDPLVCVHSSVAESELK